MGSPSRDRYARLRRIEQLDPHEDHRELTQLFYQDFQSIMLLQAVTGNLFTFAAPRMSRILTATGQFERHTAKRFLDTTLLTGAVLQHGLGPGTGRDAARRVNAMHRHYDIHPDDFIAVGCDIPLMSVQIAERYGWRPVTDVEREAVRIHYSHEARAFGSHRPLPPTLAEMRRFWEDYADTELRHEPQNQRLTDAFMAFLATLLPAPLRRIVPPLLLAQVDPRILRACGLRAPSRGRKALSTAMMHLLGRQDPRPDAPAGDDADPRSALIRSVYPGGWEVHTIGTHLDDHQRIDVDVEKRDDGAAARPPGGPPHPTQ